MKRIKSDIMTILNDSAMFVASFHPRIEIELRSALSRDGLKGRDGILHRTQSACSSAQKH